jgi:PAP2 superfamily
MFNEGAASGPVGHRMPALVGAGAAQDDGGILSPTHGWARRAALELQRSLREHSLLLAIILAYVLYGRLLPVFAGVTAKTPDQLYSGLYLGMTAVATLIFGVVYAVHLKIVVKPADYLSALRIAVFERFFTLRRVCIVLPVLLAIPLFGATFTTLKIMIPAVAPFSWDAAFAEWDRMLHAGYHPWELLQPILGHPYATTLVNAVYHLWFFLTYGVISWQMATTERPRLRMQYVISFILIWALIGNVAATLLSSAGPVYFGRVTGLDDPFTPLMAYLHDASTVSPVPALGVQDMLWSTYAAKGLAVGGGISAMPSLHVAIAFSFVLLGSAIDRRLAIAAAIFAAFILIGSVHLGWHYAIDGYVAIPMTWLIWRAVGWLLDRPFIAWLLWGPSAGSDSRRLPAVA